MPLAFRAPLKFRKTIAVAASLAVASILGADDIPLDTVSEEIDFSLRKDPYWQVSSARRALGAGIYERAIGLAESLRVESGGLDASIIRELDLIAIDAHLALEQYEMAQSIIDGFETGLGARVSLRQALVFFGISEDAVAVRRSLDGIDPELIEADGDAAWYWFLSGWLRARDGRLDDSNEQFAQAREIGGSVSPALEAQITYLAFRVNLEAGSIASISEESLRELIEKNLGSEIGFRSTQQLAVFLYESGRPDDAVEVIERNIQALPEELRDLKEEFQLMQIVTAGVERIEGRNSAEQLILAGADMSMARVGLQHVVSKCLGDGGEKGAFLAALLDQLIERVPDHALLDEALYYRSVSRFESEAFENAEADAFALLEKFPSSPYRRGMLSVMSSSAWKRKRFRTAASYLLQLRSDFGERMDTTSVSVLIGDCFFRAGLQAKSTEDYLKAAEAYSTALKGIGLGDENVALRDSVFFQLAKSYLNAGSIENAREVIDNPEMIPLTSALMRWRAEWLLLKAMRKASARSGTFVNVAYERIQDIAHSGRGELKLRFLWLAAKLSIESNQPEDTENWVESLEEFLQEEGDRVFDPELLRSVRSSALLSLADAKFLSEEPEAAIALLERVRREFADQEASLLSFVTEARYYSGENRTVDAQRLLVYLADNYPESRLAPMALYEAAINAERRGEDKFLEQAKELLDRIARDYPNDDMVYYARLKQGDLLRKLNKFGTAQQLYEDLEYQYRNRPDRYLVQMKLADTLRARSADDPSKFAAAVSRLERLLDLPEVPTKFRVEAGYKLGIAHLDQGNERQAKESFGMLQDLVMGEGRDLSELSPGVKYWLSRTLFELAEIAKSERNTDLAAQYYRMVVSNNLRGSELARVQLDRMRQELPN